ncbi:MAG: hypothetical protein Q7S54_00270 [bacterium]|nr:hypothetical protein [bacterium]
MTITSLRSLVLALLVLVVTSACGKSLVGPTPPNSGSLSVTPIDVQIGLNSAMPVEVSSGSAGIQPIVLDGQVGVQRLTQSPTTSLWSLSGQAQGPFKVAFRDNGSEGQVSGTVHDTAFVRLVPNEALPPGTSQPCGGTYRAGQFMEKDFWVDAVLGPGRDGTSQWQVTVSFAFDPQGGGPTSGSSAQGGLRNQPGGRLRATGAGAGTPGLVKGVDIFLTSNTQGNRETLAQVSVPCQLTFIP